MEFGGFGADEAVTNYVQVDRAGVCRAGDVTPGSTQMAHLTASEKLTSYTTLKDPMCGRVEAMQETSWARLWKSFQ